MQEFFNSDHTTADKVDLKSENSLKEELEDFGKNIFLKLQSNRYHSYFLSENLLLKTEQATLPVTYALWFRESKLKLSILPLVHSYQFLKIFILDNIFVV